VTSTSTGSADPADRSGTTDTVGGSTPPPGRPIRATLSPTSAVVAGLAVPGLDLRTPRAVVDARAGRRIRFRRSVLGGCAAIAAIGLAIAVFPRGEPDRVVADSDRTTTTSTVPDTTVPVDTVPVVAPTAPPTTAKATTTTAKPTTTLPPPTTVPPTTLPPNQPLTASLVVAGTPAVGSTVTVEVKWSDPDFADPAGPKATADWHDDNVTQPISGESRPPCDAPGPGGSDATVPIRLRFRYSTPGTHNLSVQIRGCDGAGAFGEDLVLTTQIQVAEPPAGSRTLLVKGPAGGQSLDAATITFVADPGAPTVLPRQPIEDLGLVSTTADAGPVTFVTVPSTFAGQVRPTTGSCGRIDPASTSVTLTQTACASTTGSTVP
jgi:hypothetical protein